MKCASGHLDAVAIFLGDRMRLGKRFAWVFTAVLAVVAVVGLGACSQSSTSEDADAIKQSLETSLEQLKTYTGEGAQITRDTLDGYVGDQLQGMGLRDDELLDAYLDGFEYEVGDVFVSGTSATAHVKLKCRSVSGIVGSYVMATIGGTDDAKATLLQIVKDAEVADSEADVYIKQADDGTWNTTDALKDALVKLCF